MTDSPPTPPVRPDNLLASVLDATQRMVPDELPDMVRGVGADVGLGQATILLADIQQRQLMPVPLAHGRSGEPQQIDGTIAGRAYWSQVALSTQDGERSRIFVPVQDGADRIGVLTAEVESDDEATLGTARRLASIVALLVRRRHVYSDRMQRLVRTREMTLAAEMQWALLPPPTFGTDALVISGAIEPAYEIGGDAYDYGMIGRVARLAVFDAMGHDLSSSLTTGIAMASWRQCRHLGRDLTVAAREIDAAITRQFDGRQFITGVLVELDSRTGELRWLVRGHPQPLLIRGGRVHALESPTGPPMGLGLPADDEISTVHLEPQDRLLCYSDGMVEARSPDGEFFGVERFTDFVIRQDSAGLSPPETMRRLVMAILDHHQGRLRDDATALLTVWKGPDEG